MLVELNDILCTKLCTLAICALRQLVGEVDPWAQFHQCSMYSLYARRSQKRKKTLMT